MTVHPGGRAEGSAARDNGDTPTCRRTGMCVAAAAFNRLRRELQSYSSWRQGWKFRVAIMIKCLSEFMIFAAVAASSARGGVVQDERDGLPPDERRILSTYKDALAVLQDHFAAVAGKFRHFGRFGITSDHELRVTEECEFARSGDMAKLVSRSTFSRRGRTDAVAPHSAVPGKDAGAPEEAFQESVLAYNGRYALKLRRFSLDKPYRVAYFDTSIGPVGRSLDRAFAHVCDPSTSAGGISIARLISRPRFAVKRISGESDNCGRRLVRLKFLMMPRSTPGGAPGEVGERDEIRSGWLLLSPEENWVLREFAFVIHAGKAPCVVQTGVVDYQQSEHGVPTPKLVRIRTMKRDAIDISPAGFEGIRGEVFQEETFELSVPRFGRRRLASSVHRFSTCQNSAVKTGGRL